MGIKKNSALEAIKNIWDLKQKAKEVLPSEVFDYLAKGTEDDLTLNRNISAYHQYQIRPRRLVDVRNIDTAVTLFGQQWQSPIAIAPVGFQGVFHENGEIATAKAAEAKQHLILVSTVSNFSYQDISQHCTRKPWFQLYPTTNRDYTKLLLERAEKNGCPVLVLTVDLPILGNRVVHVREMGHLSRLKNKYGNLQFFDDDFKLHDPSMTWDMIAWLRKHCSMKIVLKGIVRADDAQLALDYGADGIIISNHGGRQLESNLSTIECLEEIAQIVDKKIPLLIDGGIRRSTDIIKALALGADAVCVGRAFCYGLAAYGQAGVEKALEILQEELIRNMMLTGVNTLKDLNASFVRKI